MSSLRITIVFSIAMVILHFKEWQSYKTCPYNFGPFVVTSWSTMFLLGVSTELLECELCVVCGGMFMAVSLLAFFFVNPTLLVMLTLMQINKRTNCMPKSLAFVDNFQIYFNNSIIFLVLCISSIAIFVSYNKKKRMERMRKEMEAMYTRVLDPKFDIDGFIERNRESLIEVPFNKKDSVLLVDICGRAYPRNQDDLDPNDRQDCPVCIGTFEKDERVIDHPKCNHLFHHECLLTWLEKDEKVGVCPNCKGNTRLSLFEHIAAKRKESVTPQQTGQYTERQSNDVQTASLTN